MNDLVPLGVGIGTIGIVSILLIYIKRLKKKMKKFVLRFEKIKDKFD